MKLMRSPKPATESTREKTTVVAAAWAVVIPLLLVNLLAAVGQVLWAQENLVGDLPPRIATALPVLFAGAVESIALFLAYQAHQARLAGDSAGYLSVAAYGWAAVAAWLQWSHWSPTGLTAAVVYAAMSALSPWLWGIWSRSIHRAQLRTAGLIEERSVRFGRARWLLYPVRTFRVFREAVWAGESDPIGAIDRHDPGPRAPRERTSMASAPRLKRGKQAAAEAAPTDRPADQPSTPNPDPVADAVAPTPATGSDTTRDPSSAGKPTGSTPPRLNRPANGADSGGAGGTKPAPPRDVRAATPRPTPARPASRSVPDSWVRVGGSVDARLEALRHAVKIGMITRPISEPDVKAVVEAGTTAAREMRDVINAEQDDDATDGADQEVARG